MDRGEMLTIGMRMLGEARALRAAFRDTTAMGDLPISAIPPQATGEGEEVTAYRTALGYLRDEMLLVRDDKAHDLIVLDDEIACVERLLSDM